MWCSRGAVAAFAAVFLLLTCACGYHFSSASPLVLPRNMELIYLEEIQDPTTEPQLESRLRSSIRNEFTQRGNVEWVSRNRAEGLLRVTIDSFTSSAKLESAEEETVRYEAILRFRGRIFESTEQNLVWESGGLTVRESYSDQAEREQAQIRVMRLAAEELANKLAQRF